jgi:hypothetical protein
MNNQFFKQLPHVSVEPVQVERVYPDRLKIAGVLYDGDYFRTFGAPDTNVLYAVVRDDDGCVCLTVIDSVEKAKEFFEEVENAI